MQRGFINYVVAVVIAAGVGVALAWALITTPSAVLAWLNQDEMGKSAYERVAAIVARPVLPPPLPITLTFVGDIMLDRGVAKSYKENGGLDWLFEGVKPIGESDILFGNLEGPISDRGRNVGSKYSFRMATSSAPALASVGFDVLSVANNHAGDWSVPAFTDTLQYLEQNNIVAVGGGLTRAGARAVKVVEVRGVKVGYLGFSDVGPEWLRVRDDAPGILLTNDPEFESIISMASSQVDVLVVSFHWGEEYKTLANERQKQLANQALVAGAKLVIGHHPHVVEPIERSDESLVAYSLGNFIFDQGFSEETMQGLALTVRLNPDGGIKDYQTTIVKLSPEFKPALEVSQSHE